jgi:hypothetical protein
MFKIVSKICLGGTIPTKYFISYYLKRNEPIAM